MAQLDYGKYGVADKYLYGANRLRLSELLKYRNENNKINNFGNIFNVNSDEYLLSISGLKEFHYVYLNTLNNSMEFLNINKIFDIPIKGLCPVSWEDGKMYCSVHAIDFLDSLKDNPSYLENSIVSAIAARIKEDDNPVLLVFTAAN